jgi:hypothetical protein
VTSNISATHAQPTPELKLAFWKNWPQLNRTQKILWGVTLVVMTLHLLLFLLTPLSPNYTPEVWREHGSSDLVVYTDAAAALTARQPLYALTKEQWTLINENGVRVPTVQVFVYTPPFALIFSIFSSVLPFRYLAICFVIVLTLAYFASWYVWYRVFKALKLDAVANTVVLWMPVALTFTGWYANLYYMNIIPILLLLTGLLTWALITDQAVLAGLCATAILLAKPHWLFPFLLPIVFRQWKLFFKAIGVTVVGYLVVNAAFIAIVGPTYGVQQIRDYVTFLTNGQKFVPLDGITPTFTTENHSIDQTLLHYFGFQPWVFPASTAIKLALIAIVVVMIVWSWRFHLRPETDGQIGLMFIWLGYLVAMVFLAELYEVFLSILIFIFLQPYLSRRLKWIGMLVFAYIWFEIPSAIGLATNINVLILSQSLPLTLITLLILYGLLLILIPRQISERRLEVT